MNPGREGRKRLRVIHCGTGVAGQQALRAILGNTTLELVGLLVHSPSREGKDAVELAGLSGPECEIKGQADFAAILGLDADVVCYMMLVPDIDQICTLLASGKNVVTTAGLMYPSWNDVASNDLLQRACRKGRSSFYVTGINPGWVDEVLPLTMSGLCQRIKRIHIREYADCSRYPAPHIINVMGFGKPLEDIKAGRLPDLAIMRDFFIQSVAALADELDLKLDEITESREFVMAPHAYDIKAGYIAKGTIAGQRWRWQGIAAGAAKIVQETFWITAFDLGEGWPASGQQQGDTQWQVTIEGTPSLRCTFEPRHSFAKTALEQATPDYNPSGLATAMAAVNSLPAVVQARPGILGSSDLTLPRCRQIAYA